MPTLALNYATNDTQFLRSFYQFALAPEDEARAIAAAAIAAGAKTALAFVPSNQARLSRSETTSAPISRRPAASCSIGTAMSRRFRTSRSRRRLAERQTQRGAPPAARGQSRRARAVSEARRRQDVDMIFAVVADARTGRLIASQLRFFGAGDIPVYANAEIFDPANTARDNDLNGFIFADTPALLSPDADASALRGDLQAYWPERTSLVAVLRHGVRRVWSRRARCTQTTARAWSMRGLSGDLSLDAQGRVRRVLPLAQFRSGRPVALDAQPLQPIDSGRLDRPALNARSRAAASGSRAPRRISSGTASKSSRVDTAAGSARSTSCAATTGSSSS